MPLSEPSGGLSLPNPADIVRRLRELQCMIRDAIVASRGSPLSGVERATQADTIYQLDTLVEPIVDDYCRHWSITLPMVVIAEGLEPESGKVFPEGLEESRAVARIIFDPVDGTRGLMYDKRSAWSLAGAAPNRGSATTLRDIEVAVMTELPTSKMGLGDVLSAIKGQGATAERESLAGPANPRPLALRPSQAAKIDHGFAMISNFFPGTKVLASELMEHLVQNLIGPADVTRATVFEDQYISTGGQFYELLIGHDRFNADLRSIFYQIQNQPEGLCVHPYDACCVLIAEEAGLMLTDPTGQPLNAPLDTTTGLSWMGFANPSLAHSIGPMVTAFLRAKGWR